MNEPATRWVVAFNRDRDFYQVPLALAEEGMLARLVTDLYAAKFGPLVHLPGLRSIRHRRAPGLPAELVRCNREALRLQLFGLRKAKETRDRIDVFKRLDIALSQAALREASALDAHLLLYSGYAREAFLAPERSGRLKGLFVYHPHGGLCGRILEEDLAEHPEAAWSHELHMKEIALAESGRLEEEIAAADFILCASAFTARSLEELAQVPEQISVCPYGSFIETEQPQNHRADPEPEPGTVRFLFVGQGVQRKGLHHLLKVWRELALEDAHLTCVCSSLDPGIEKLAEGLDTVTLFQAQSRERLRGLYGAADIFVMPSLVEGFGLVYLEALAAGCFVIGTGNTGLPDLDPAPDAACVTPAGDLEALAAALDLAQRRAADGMLDRAAIRNYAHTLSWERFREGIRCACHDALAALGEPIPHPLTAES